MELLQAAKFGRFGRMLRQKNARVAAGGLQPKVQREETFVQCIHA
jgi:hypothetical protein